MLLLLDNFAGHSIAYKPTNVRIEFLAPNMTSRIQPLDAGVIRAFKAHYRRAFCLRALDADDAGEPDIWKINLLEAMHMARRAWEEITADTIRNCWRHTGILPECAAAAPAAPPAATPPASLAAAAASSSTPAVSQPGPAPDVTLSAWRIILDFAADEHGTLPAVEDMLRALLGDAASSPLWVKALAIANCEPGEESAALAALETLCTESNMTKPGTPPRAPAPAPAPIQGAPRPATRARTAQLLEAERELMDSVQKLKARNRIWDVPTLDELLDPVEERQVGEGPHELATDDQIVAAVREEEAAKAAVAAGATSADADADSDDEDDVGPSTDMTTDELVLACDQILDACVRRGLGNILDVQRELMKVKGELRRAQQKNAKQLTLKSFFKAPALCVEGQGSSEHMDIDSSQGRAPQGNL